MRARTCAFRHNDHLCMALTPAHSQHRHVQSHSRTRAVTLTHTWRTRTYLRACVRAARRFGIHSRSTFHDVLCPFGVMSFALRHDTPVRALVAAVACADVRHPCIPWQDHPSDKHLFCRMVEYRRKVRRACMDNIQHPAARRAPRMQPSRAGVAAAPRGGASLRRRINCCAGAWLLGAMCSSMAWHRRVG
jgi:hypothetical protein